MKQFITSLFPSQLGAKKGGLGATRVKTNFAEVEKEAELNRQTHMKIFDEASKTPVASNKEKEEVLPSMRLAYTETGNKNEMEKKSFRDVQKTEQAQRLGMGIPTKM